MKQHTKKIASYIVTAAVIVCAAVWALSKLMYFSKGEFTDNAQVRQQIVPIVSRVQGYIKEIRFDEFSKVNKGDTLVIIDDADMRLALARAQADYANALAGKGLAERGISVAGANSAVSKASIEEARVLMENARTDFNRYSELLKQNAVTQQQYDGAKTAYEAAKARYDMLSRQLEAADRRVDESRRRSEQSDAGIDLAKALVETAELNLSYTVVVAPCYGYASRKDIQVGQLVQPGQTLLDVVDCGDVWVTANYKETQLKGIAIGSEAEIKVDAIPGTVFHGTVSAISKATGAAVSLLPQDNSAGNFVKVRQRVPVRIAFDSDNDSAAMQKLRAGMNVECVIK